MIAAEREGLGPLFNCASTDVIGSPVRISSPNTVTTADASSFERSIVIGFIGYKPTPTTCYIVNNYYYSGASGFSGFSGMAGDNSYGQPVYLTNSSGFSGKPSTVSKVLGESISPREALLRADPKTAIDSTSPTFKNRIINGSMDVWQSGISFSAPITGIFQADRFKIINSTTNRHTITQSSDVPTFAQAGRNINFSTKYAVSTAAAFTTNDYYFIRHIIEGYHIQDIVGNGYNQGFTLSFWIKAGKVGTMNMRFYGGGPSEDATYIQEFPVSTNWEKKTITVTTAPSNGTWPKTNGIGLGIDWIFNCGSTYQSTTVGAWQPAVKLASFNQTNFCSIANSTCDIYLTGVQLEAGTIATDFEIRAYPTELLFCQRYLETWGGDSTTQAVGTGTCYVTAAASTTNVRVAYPFKVKKRGNPTLFTSVASDFGLINATNSAGYGGTAISQESTSTDVMNIDFQFSSATTTAGQCLRVQANTTTSARLYFLAEL